MIEKDLAAGLIDEIPVLAVLGAASEEGLLVRDAQELRIKETDRIATVAENFERMGIEIEVTQDGMRIPGSQKFRAAAFDSFERSPHRYGSRLQPCAPMANRQWTMPTQRPCRFRNFGISSGKPRSDRP